MPFSFEELEQPIVGAPLAGGPSTVALTAAVSEAGGLGFLAAGYKAPEAVGAEVAALRERTRRPFGLNLFAPPAPVADAGAVERYAARLRAEAERVGAPVGAPRHDDDGWEAKLALAERERVPVVSFTFGRPDAGVVARLRAAGSAVWVTVTTPDEARRAAAAGADALVVQGAEAGGHRASFDDASPGDLGLLALLALVRAQVELPLVATGGLVTGRSIAAVLAAGASAAQIGTALLRTPEAGTSAPHRAALAASAPEDAAAGARAGATVGSSAGAPVREGAPTALTRAFTGRTARGIVNRFMLDHGAQAPAAYPDVNHLTAPVRAAARERGDADVLNLWAGQAYPLAEEVPAGELVRRLAAEARAALAEAARRHG